MGDKKYIQNFFFEKETVFAIKNFLKTESRTLLFVRSQSYQISKSQSLITSTSHSHNREISLLFLQIIK